MRKSKIVANTEAKLDDVRSRNEAVDWARLAAFIDGEGCISIKHKKPRGNKGLQHGIYLNIINTDARLVLWVQEHFGGILGCLNYRNSEWGHKPWKASFRWEAYGPYAVGLLRECYPYLVIKKEQADIVFALQANIDCQRRGQGAAVSQDTRDYREELKQQLHATKRTEYTLSNLGGASCLKN